jgi:hypothetical protein
MSSIFIGTRPRTPSTMRTRSGRSARIGMKSISRTVPSSVSSSCSSTSVSPRYCRRDAVILPCGVISQRPCSGSPSSDAKHAPESKRGKHSQSTEPSRPINAIVCVSPTIA